MFVFFPILTNVDLFINVQQLYRPKSNSSNTDLVTDTSLSNKSRRHVAWVQSLTWSNIHWNEWTSLDHIKWRKCTQSLILRFKILSILSATEEVSAGNHPPHSNKWTPSPTHQERPVCDVPLPGGMSPILLQQNILLLIILHSFFATLKTVLWVFLPLVVDLIWFSTAKLLSFGI